MLAAVRETLPAAGSDLSEPATAVLPAGSPVRAPEFSATTGDPTGATGGEDLERLVYLGRMVSAVSHELGNRLTSVLGFAEMAAQTPDPETAPRLLAKMNNYAENLRVLVESLSGFSSHRMAAREACDPGTLVRQVVELASCEAKTTGVRVVFHRKAELPQLHVVVGEARLGLFMCLDAMVRNLAQTGVRDAHLLAEVRKAPDGGVQVVFRPSDPLDHGKDEESISAVLARAGQVLAAQGANIKWSEREKGANELVAEFSCEVCSSGP
jgi:hypothetical protein